MIKPPELMWIKRGKQKQSVFRVMIRPASPSELLRDSRRINPKITFGDVSNIIREAERKGIMECLTPDRLTGRIYFLTASGRSLVSYAYGLKIRKEKKDIDWNKYAVVIAGKVRKHILSVLEGPGAHHKAGMNLIQIRRKVNIIIPIHMNQTLASLRLLVRSGLVRLKSHSKKKGEKLYELTEEGKQISGYIRENSQ